MYTSLIKNRSLRIQSITKQISIYQRKLEPLLPNRLKLRSHIRLISAIEMLQNYTMTDERLLNWFTKYLPVYVSDLCRIKSSPLDTSLFYMTENVKQTFNTVHLHLLASLQERNYRNSSQMQIFFLPKKSAPKYTRAIYTGCQ